MSNLSKFQLSQTNNGNYTWMLKCVCYIISAQLNNKQQLHHSQSLKGLDFEDSVPSFMRASPTTPLAVLVTSLSPFSNSRVWVYCFLCNLVFCFLFFFFCFSLSLSLNFCYQLLLFIKIGVCK